MIAAVADLERADRSSRIWDVVKWMRRRQSRASASAIERTVIVVAVDSTRSSTAWILIVQRFAA